MEKKKYVKVEIVLYVARQNDVVRTSDAEIDGSKYYDEWNDTVQDF